MAKRKRSGKRRSPETQYKRQNAADWRKIQAKRRLVTLLRKKAALQRAIRDRDAQLIYEHETLTKTQPKRLDRRGTKDTAVFKGSAYYAKKDGAARSARSQTAPHKKPPVRITPKRGPILLKRFNDMRRKKRNKWAGDPCVNKPDSRKAGKIRQSPEIRGGGSGSYVQRRWC